MYLVFWVLSTFDLCCCYSVLSLLLQTWLKHKDEQGCGSTERYLWALRFGFCTLLPNALYSTVLLTLYQPFENGHAIVLVHHLVQILSVMKMWLCSQNGNLAFWILVFPSRGAVNFLCLFFQGTHRTSSSHTQTPSLISKHHRSFLWYIRLLPA